MANYYLRGERFESLDALIKECKKETLAHRLRAHDWHYQYADDFRAWNAGNESMRNIERLIDELGEDGREIFKAYRAKMRGE